MGAPIQTTVSELPDSRVRVEVQVAPEEVDARLQRTARRLGRQLKLPGFRRGKVPPPLVLQRLGREAVLDETVRDTLPSWYAEAIRGSRIVPVGDPDIDIDLGALPDSGQELKFSIEIGVLPKARLGEYLGLEVGRREVEVPDGDIERELQAVRERFARLDAVQREAGAGDYVVVDYLGSLPAGDEVDGEGVEGGEASEGGADDENGADAGAGEGGEGREKGDFRPFAGGEGRDQLIELGSGKLIPGFEDGLLGARAGEERTVRVTFPEDYGAPELAGRDASFAITVKEVKAKQLPDLDDDLAVDAGFEDLTELREDIATRLRTAREQEIENEFREAVLDAAVQGAQVPVTDELAGARAQEMWERMLHSLSHRGISRETYLQISGREEQEILAEMRPEARRALAREAVLTAIVAAESIEPSDEDLLEMLGPAAESEGVSPKQVLEQLRSSKREDRIEELREDLAARQALDLIVERAVAIPADRRSTGSPIGQQAAAREKLWTPEKDAAGEGAAAGGAGDAGGAADEGGGEKLWTPSGSGGSG